MKVSDKPSYAYANYDTFEDMSDARNFTTLPLMVARFK